MREDTEILRVFIRESLILLEDESDSATWGARSGTAEIGYGMKALKAFGNLYDALKGMIIRLVNMTEIFIFTLINTGAAAAEGISSLFGSKANYDGMITNQREMLRNVRERSRNQRTRRVDQLSERIILEQSGDVQDIVSSVQLDIDNVVDIFDTGSMKGPFSEMIKYFSNELDLVVSPFILSLFTIEGMSTLEGREVTSEEFEIAQEQLASVMKAVIPAVLNLFLKEMSKSIVDEVSSSFDFSDEEVEAIVPVIQSVYDSAMKT